jgi:hypothetical protein
MIGPIRDIASSFPAPDSIFFALSFDQSSVMHLSAGNLLRLLAHLNLKEFKNYLQPYVAPDS